MIMATSFEIQPTLTHDPISMGPGTPAKAVAPRPLLPVLLDKRLRQWCGLVRSAAWHALLVGLAALPATAAHGQPEPSRATDTPRLSTRPAPSNVSATAPASGTPKARFDQLVYEFPEVWSGRIIEHTWAVHNDGDGPLELLAVEPSCGCTAAEFDKRILPGGQGKIAAKLDTRGLNGDVIKTILVRTNAPQAGSVTLQFHGKVKSRINMEPPSGAQFGQLAPTSDLTRTVTLTNNTSTPLKMEPVTTQPSPFSHTLKEVEQGQKYELVVSADRDKLKEGLNNVQMKFKTGLAEEPEFLVPVSIYVPPLVQVLPPTIAMLTPLTADFHREIMLRYTGEGSMKITGVSATDPAIKVQAMEVPQPPPPAGATPRPSGRIWKLVVDIPRGWKPPQARPVGEPEFQSGLPPIEIVAQTDLKEKAEIRIHVQALTQSRTPSQTSATTQPR
jgi:hypothetical protein